MAATKHFLDFARSIEERLERGDTIDPQDILRLCESIYQLEQTSNIDQVFRELVDWNNGHKARDVEITCPNGYGAGCWTVTLGHEHGQTHASEVSFFTYPDEKGGKAAYNEEARKLGTVFANVNPDGTEYEYGTWPGLRDTVRAALNGFSDGIYKKKRE